MLLIKMEQPMCPYSFASPCLCAFSIVFHTREELAVSKLLQAITLLTTATHASLFLEIFPLKCLILRVYGVIFSFLAFSVTRYRDVFWYYIFSYIFLYYFFIFSYIFIFLILSYIFLIFLKYFYYSQKLILISSDLQDLLFYKNLKLCN